MDLLKIFVEKTLTVILENITWKYLDCSLLKKGNYITIYRRFL